MLCGEGELLIRLVMIQDMEPHLLVVEFEGSWASVMFTNPHRIVGAQLFGLLQLAGRTLQPSNWDMCVSMAYQEALYWCRRLTPVRWLEGSTLVLHLIFFLCAPISLQNSQGRGLAEPNRS